MGGTTKRKSMKNVPNQKWQPGITNSGCPKQNLFAPSRYI